MDDDMLSNEWKEETLDEELLPADKSKYILYRSFLNLNEAKELTDLLDARNIPCALNIPRESIDAAIIGQGIVTKATLKVHPAYVKQVDTIIEEAIEKIPLEELEKHPLQSYANDDLYNILLKPDESTVENVTLAQLILSNRGQDVTVEEVEELRSKRINEIRKGKKGSQWVIVVVFVTMILGFLVRPLLSALGIFVGAYYINAKKYDINGDAYLEYDKPTRFVGKVLLGCSIALLAIKYLMGFLF